MPLPPYCSKQRRPPGWLWTALALLLSVGPQQASANEPVCAEPLEPELKQRVRNTTLDCMELADMIVNRRVLPKGFPVLLQAIFDMKFPCPPSNDGQWKDDQGKSYELLGSTPEILMPWSKR